MENPDDQFSRTDTFRVLKLRARRLQESPVDDWHAYRLLVIETIDNGAEHDTAITKIRERMRGLAQQSAVEALVFRVGTLEKQAASGGDFRKQIWLILITVLITTAVRELVRAVFHV